MSEVSSSNITDRHREIFAALTSGRYGNFQLVSTEFDGVPTVAVVATVGVDEDTVGLAPLLVFVTDKRLFRRLAEPSNELAAQETADGMVDGVPNDLRALAHALGIQVD